MILIGEKKQTLDNPGRGILGLWRRITIDIRTNTCSHPKVVEAIGGVSIRYGCFEDFDGISCPHGERRGNRFYHITKCLVTGGSCVFIDRSNEIVQAVSSRQKWFVFGPIVVTAIVAYAIWALLR